MIKIIEKSIDELIPYENNARINDNAVEAVANSIQEFGFKNPIIIDGNNVVIAGHTRLKALEKLGIKKAPCIIADDLTEEQIKAFRIADNSTAQIADWDLEKLNIELQSIDYNMALFGLDEQIKEIEKQFAKEVIEDEVPEVEDGEPICKLGDIWQLGRHRLMCGDSTKEEAVDKLMNGNKADMVFTDPPYGVSYEGINNDEESGLEELLLKSFQNYSENMEKGSSIYVFHADRKQTTVFEIGKERVEGHTTPKPLEFIGEALRNSSRKGDIVLDLFGGSGSTLIACEQLNRTCYMMELDPKYCDVIIKRYENLTGQKAIKIC